MNWKKLTILAVIVNYFMGCAMADDFEKEVENARRNDGSLKVNISTVINKYIYVGMEKEESIDFLKKRNFKIFFHKKSPLQGAGDIENLHAQKRLNTDFVFGDDIHIDIVFKDKKVSAVIGSLNLRHL